MIKYLSFVLLLSIALPSIAQKLTVKQLYDEYRANRATFQDKYKNKTITVTGKIRSISVASSFWKDQDVHRVHLTATGYENFVVCQIPYKDSAILNTMKVGDFITVTGTAPDIVGDAVFLSNCTFSSAKPTVIKSTAPDNAPLGKYNVYQDDGTGFNFQYTLYLKSYTSYTLNNMTGACAYNPKTKTISFSTGPIKGFAGIYRKTTDNPADPPSFLLNAKGTTPVVNSQHHGYQFAYYQGK